MVERTCTSYRGFWHQKPVLALHMAQRAVGGLDRIVLTRWLDIVYRHRKILVGADYQNQHNARTWLWQSGRPFSR